MQYRKKIMSITEPQSRDGSIKMETLQAKTRSRTRSSIGTQHIRTYKKRFWILIVYSVLLFFQFLQWNIWGPLNESVGAVFTGWDSGTVAMVANWGPLSFLFSCGPCFWFVHTKGLRMGIVALAGVTFAAAVFRAIPFFTTSDTLFTVMCHLASIANGLASPLALATPPKIASVWFPPKERTTATAFAQLLNQMGIAGSYLQPLIVRSPSEAGEAAIKSDLARLMYIYTGIGAVIFIAILIYFPAQPPTPPSLSSGLEEIPFKENFKQLIKNSSFYWIFSAAILEISVPSVWLSVLVYSLIPFGFDQNEAMWVGFFAVIASVVMGMTISRLTDLVYGHLRVTLMVLLAINLVIFYWFFLLTWGCIIVTKWQVYVSVILGISMSVSTVPIFVELSVEKVYPCSEMLVTGYVTLGCNCISVIFLLLFLIPDLGYDWVTYALLGSSTLSLLCLSFAREEYNRSNFDKGESSLEASNDK